jgi:hypothetical protein
MQHEPNLLFCQLFVFLIPFFLFLRFLMRVLVVTAFGPAANRKSLGFTVQVGQDVRGFVFYGEFHFRGF